MSYKLRAYRVAGDATCPEAIISCLLLYAIRYIFKHVSRDGSVTANELHEILHAMKPREALLSFLSKLSMLSLHLPVPPRAADTLYETSVSQRRSSPLHLSLALANRSRYLFCCHDWICLNCIEDGSRLLTTSWPQRHYRHYRQPLPPFPTSLPTFFSSADSMT